MDKPKVINIDWLQVFGQLQQENNLPARIEALGYVVKDNERGTRLFERWLTIYRRDNASPFIQLCYMPFSVRGVDVKGIFKPKSCTIQLCNKFLYAGNPASTLSSFCLSIGFTYQSISRVDICCDFEYFDSGLSPQTLLRGVYSCKYLKVRQLKIRDIATQNTEMNHHYMAWGSERSKVGTKIYDKTKELEEVKDKPYIRDVWKLNGLGASKHVWRIEFSIKSDGRDFVKTDTGELIKVGLRELYNTSDVNALFFILCHHYFRFKVAVPGKRKTLCSDLNLFNIDSGLQSVKPIKITTSKDLDKKRKMLINTLNEELSDHTLSIDERKTISDMLYMLSTKYRMKLLNNLKNNQNDEK